MRRRGRRDALWIEWRSGSQEICSVISIGSSSVRAEARPARGPRFRWQVGHALARERQTASWLPPLRRATTEIVTLLDDAVLGLQELTARPEPYSPRLSLDAVVQPYVTGVVSRFGGMYGGGVAFAMSDMLGNHNLVTAVDVSSMSGVSDLYKNTSAVTTYTNDAQMELGRRRWPGAVPERRIRVRRRDNQRRAQRPGRTWVWSFSLTPGF